MAARGTGAVIRQIGALYRGGSVAGLTDAQLLERFAAKEDEATAELAFAAIVARHGPMVLGVCRRLVRDPIAAEDAFQATFLVLSRRAGAVRVDDSLGRWLHGVARRVASRARRRTSDRKEASVEAIPEVAAEGPGPLDAAIARERDGLIRSEVDRLPDRYRDAVVLCHLEGRSVDEAASRLGRPVGTIKVRLSRARALLRDRLSRRGLAPGVLLPVVPAALIHRAVQAAVRDAFRTGGLAAVASGTVLTLADGVIVMTKWMKVQAAGVALLSMGVTVAAVGGLAAREGEDGGDGPSDPGRPVASAASLARTVATDAGADDPASDPRDSLETGVDQFAARLRALKSRIDHQKRTIQRHEEIGRRLNLEMVRLTSELIGLEREAKSYAGRLMEADPDEGPSAPLDVEDAELIVRKKEVEDLIRRNLDRIREIQDLGFRYGQESRDLQSYNLGLERQLDALENRERAIRRRSETGASDPGDAPRPEAPASPGTSSDRSPTGDGLLLAPRTPFDHEGEPPAGRTQSGRTRTPFDVDPRPLGNPSPIPSRRGPAVERPVRPTGEPDRPLSVEPEPVEPAPEADVLPEVPEWVSPAAPRERVDDEGAPPEYVVEPPDLIRIEVLEALPGRPITGERLVRPDGRVSLDFYGELHVAGRTLSEIKEKVILHLRRFLTDESLGLMELDGATPRYEMIHPKDSNRVFIDVSAYNSQVYYIQGDVAQPGRIPVTGRDSVLDAITYAGGLLPSADPKSIRLIRPPGTGSDQPAEVLPIDWEAIVERGDPATNYRLRPGDRILVFRENVDREGASTDPRIRLERRIEEAFKAHEDVRAVREAIRDLDVRIGEAERRIRNPGDPAVSRLKLERKRLYERYEQLWADLGPALRAQFGGGGADLLPSGRPASGSAPLTEETDEPEAEPPTADDDGDGAEEVPEDGGEAAEPPEIERSFLALIEKLDALAGQEDPGTFTVSGEVGTPGQFVVAGDMRVSDALELTGGIKSGTARPVVYLLRPGEAIRKVAIRDWNRPEREEDDVPIRQGDQLVVPRNVAPVYRAQPTPRDVPEVEGIGPLPEPSS